jgi:F-box and leucine-rich repeat protein GRR1
METFLKFAENLPPHTKNPSTLFPYAHFVRRLNLMNVANELSPELFVLLEGCTQLERLTMAGAVQITDPVVADVVPKFKRLLALDISSIELGDEGLCAVAENCRELQGLNVSQCSRLTDRSLMAVAENCHKLRRVKQPSFFCPDLGKIG